MREVRGPCACCMPPPPLLRILHPTSTSLHPTHRTYAVVVQILASLEKLLLRIHFHPALPYTARATAPLSGSGFPATPCTYTLTLL
jgi:hypothetical protein